MKNIEGQRITVLGAVRSGLGAAKLIKRMGGIPFVSDMAPKEKLQKQIEELEAAGVDFEYGGHSERVFDTNLIITSPGIPLDSAVLIKARNKNLKVISEVEFASWFCKGKIVSITGTNGKTTTTSLVAHMLNHCGLKTYSAGNIGLAFSEIAADVKENEIVALETSSFQLDHLATFKPNIAVILNITPDHLDRYEHKYENYIQSKYKIFQYQAEDNYLILNADDEHLKVVDKSGPRKLFFSLKEEQFDGAYYHDGTIYYKNVGIVEFEIPIKNLSLKGEHNYANSMAAIIIAKVLECDNVKISESLASFPGVEHRLEFVRELDGVTFINDSKATNVDSVWYALRSFDQPIFLILGGKDKGNDYNQIKELVIDKVKKIYAIGSSADKVFNFFHHHVKVEIKATLEECVYTANSEARENEVVLLSPACASFDMFDSYEHRGRVFKEAVNRL